MFKALLITILLFLFPVSALACDDPFDLQAKRLSQQGFKIETLPPDKAKKFIEVMKPLSKVDGDQVSYIVIPGAYSYAIVNKGCIMFFNVVPAHVWEGFMKKFVDGGSSFQKVKELDV